MSKAKLTFYNNGSIPSIKQWFEAEAQFKKAGGDIFEFNVECVERTNIFKGLKDET